MRHFKKLLELHVKLGKHEQKLNLISNLKYRATMPNLIKIMSISLDAEEQINTTSSLCISYALCASNT